MTQIAVDWQVHAGDGRYYDVIFVGTGEFIFTEHFSLGSNPDAFITWRLNNLESILRFFFLQVRLNISCTKTCGVRFLTENVL